MKEFSSSIAAMKKTVGEAASTAKEAKKNADRACAKLKWLPSGAQGLKEGFIPSEEERTKDLKEAELKGDQLAEEKEGTFDLQSTSEYKEAIDNLLDPPVAPSMVSQVIHEGFLEHPEISPEHVVIFAEGIPSWLASADAWGSSQLSMYCEKEELWYRKNLDVMTPLDVYPTVAGMSRASWKTSTNKMILVQGSSSFCKKMIAGLQSIGISEEDKIVVASVKVLNLVLNFYVSSMLIWEDQPTLLLRLVFPRVVICLQN